MGALDDVFVSSSNPAVPGGGVTKPLMIALLALLASRYMSGGTKESPNTASSNPEPTNPEQSNPVSETTDVLGGLGGLLKQFQQGGFGDAINSWIGTGSNKPVSVSEVSNALGPQIIDTLSQRTGLPKDQILQILSQVLPGMVDQLTPDGRLPSKQEITKLIG
jgi:uncharacterized protein YidB (DUF937 family)